MKKALTAITPFIPHIAIGLVLIITLVIVRKQIMNIFSGFGSGDRSGDIQDLTDSLSQYQKVRLPRDDSYYQLMANKLYSAMDQWVPSFITRFDDATYKELESLSADELRRIVSEFGLKRKATFGGLITQLEKASLFEWFEDELGRTELDRMRSIFKKTGLWG